MLQSNKISSIAAAIVVAIISLECLTAASAANDAVPFDAKDYFRKQRLEIGLGGLEICYDRTISGLLINGLRSRSQLLAMAINICSSGYRKQLVLEGASEKAAEAYVELIATEALDDVLRGAR